MVIVGVTAMDSVSFPSKWFIGIVIIVAVEVAEAVVGRLAFKIGLWGSIMAFSSSKSVIATVTFMTLLKGGKGFESCGREGGK